MKIRVILNGIHLNGSHLNTTRAAIKKCFTQVRIGQLFHVHGNLYRKKSTRTAVLLSYGRVFYFSKNEVVYN
jgi:hypothetical protein